MIQRKLRLIVVKIFFPEKLDFSIIYDSIFLIVYLWALGEDKHVILLLFLSVERWHFLFEINYHDNQVPLSFKI